MPVLRWRTPPSPFFFPDRAAAPALALALLAAALRPAWGQADAAALAAAAPAPASHVPTLVQPPPAALEPAAPPPAAADLAQAREAWQRANQRVAEFPRGHADLLKWEAGQPSLAAAPAPAPERAGPPLEPAEALRVSLRHRPELFLQPGMSARERAAVQADFTEHVRQLRHAWTDAVAARQSWRLRRQMLDAARTGSELGQRMAGTGNWDAARAAREQLVLAQAWQAAWRAQAEALESQERLALRLGLWDARTVAQLAERLPQALPAVPTREAFEQAAGDAAALESAALRSHRTLAADRFDAERQSAAVFDASRREAWGEAVDAALQAAPLDLAAAPRIDPAGALREPAVQHAIRAESELLHRAAERRSAARQAWIRLQASHALALHAQGVVAPLQASLEQDSLLRYNGMLLSSWELLASARERLRALDDALLAQRDFWRAQADWQALLGGGQPR